MKEATVRIRAIRTVGPDTVAIDLETPKGFDASPGQFVKLTAFVDGEHVSRFYTLSSPHVTETFELTIGIDPDGALGPWVATAEGEEVRIEGPYGRAFYEDEPKSLILAGGPGVGPAVGIAERALSDGNQTAIVYQDEEPVHEDRLADLTEQGVSVIVTSGDIEKPVRDCFSTDVQVFIYGFRDFVTKALTAVEAMGGDPDTVKIENFG